MKHLFLASLLLPFSLFLSVAAPEPSASPASSLNTSTDLTRLKIAEQNIVPGNKDLDAGPLLTAALAYASQNGIGTVSLPKGDYYFKSKNGGRAFVTLRELKNVVLEGNGSTFHFLSRNITGISMWECSGIGVQNLTLDYDGDLPYTSAVVGSVDLATNTVHFSKVLGRPVSELDNLNPKKGIRVFVLRKDQNGAMANQLERYFVEPGFKLQDDKIVLSSGRIPKNMESLKKELAQMRSGDVLVISERSLDGVNAIEFSSHRAKVCTGNYAKNVTIYSSPAVGMAALWQKEVSFSKITVTPHPARTASQFISSNADGINNSNAAKYEVTDSVVVLPGDDCISFSTGSLGAVAEVRDADTIVVSGGRYPFYAGESLSFSAPSTQKVLGTATITKVTPLPAENGKPANPVALTFDRPLPAVIPESVVFQGFESNAPGILIRGNTAQGSYARGIYLSGVRGAKIVSNKVSYSTGPGLLAAASNERTGFRSPGNSNIEISGNSVLNVYSWGLCGNIGGIEVTVVNAAGQTSEKVSSDISILNNTVSIENSKRRYYGIYVSNTENAKVEGNTVEVLDHGTPSPELQKQYSLLIK